MVFNKNTAMSPLLQMRRYFLRKMQTLIREIIKVVHHVREFPSTTVVKTNTAGHVGVGGCRSLF